MDNQPDKKKMRLSGWWVVGGLWLVYFVTNGIVFNTFPNFTPELMTEFGWDESEATSPTAILFFSIAFVTIGLGALLDRVSARAIMLVSAFGMLVTMIGFAVLIPAAPGYWGLYEAGGVFSLIVLGVVSTSNQSTAFAVTLMTHLVQYIPIVAIGLYFAGRAHILPPTQPDDPI